MEEPSLFATLLPLILFFGLTGVISAIMARNMGLNAILYGLIGVIPLLGSYVVFVILSKENRHTVQRLERIEDLLRARGDISHDR